jgi:hypothetical protein
LTKFIVFNSAIKDGSKPESQVIKTNNILIENFLNYVPETSLAYFEEQKGLDMS